MANTMEMETNKETKDSILKRIKQIIFDALESKRTRQIILFALGISVIFATYFLARFLWEKPDEYQDLIVPQAAMTEEEIFTVFEEAIIDEVYVPYTGPIDFAALWEINEDVYAWIRVAGTDIDYPILQHPSDDTKYLNYNIDGSYGLPGCIYTEKMNTKDWSDPNTVLYGHNMKNGTMFAKLHEFRKLDFFADNRDITIFMPDGEIYYQIFAAYIYDDRHLMYSFDFNNPDVYAAYLESIYNIRDMTANIDKEMVITNDDQIITLATCVSGQDDKRLLVQAIRIGEQKW